MSEPRIVYMFDYAQLEARLLDDTISKLSQADAWHILGELEPGETRERFKEMTFAIRWGSSGRNLRDVMLENQPQDAETRERLENSSKRLREIHQDWLDRIQSK